MLDVPLEVPLGALLFGWRRQGHHAAVTRVEQGGHPLDDAALARGVSSLEDDDDTQAAVTDPLLELQQLHLQPAELLFVTLLGQLVDLCHLSTKSNPVRGRSVTTSPRGGEAVCLVSGCWS